jgi:cobalt/nickel transport system permease protein
MHMANELLSVPVAAGSFAAAGICLSYICKKAKEKIATDQFALMGIMGAFVFAAQMINFQMPLLPGTSGHLIGATLVAILLGPFAGTIVISSVVIIQCLIFQDGGLLAIGCNLLNMAIVPSFLGFYIYKTILGNSTKPAKIYAASVIACVISLTVSALLVPIQAGFSGVLTIPVGTFMLTMAGVHSILGIIEGVITAGVVVYLKKVRPALLENENADHTAGRRTFYIACAVCIIFITTVLIHFASEKPDGLEWSYSERPDQPEFESIITNDSKTVETVEAMQTKYTPLPDYDIRPTQKTGIVGPEWKSFAAVIGSVITMGIIWLIGWIVQKKASGSNASCTD